MEKLLSAGAITQILENQKPVNPVLQIIGYKPMTPDQIAFGVSSDELRYRLMIGDGIKAHQYCVITNQDIVEDIKSGRLEKWSIIKVISYQTVDYGDGPPENKRRLIYILNLEVVKPGREVGAKLNCSKPADQAANPPMQRPTEPSGYGAGLSNSYAASNPYSNAAMQQSTNRPPNNPYAPTSMDTQPQPYQYGQPDLIRSPRVMRTSQDQAFISISELSPYIGKWAIKGRVVSKGAVREYNNAKGGGKVSSFTVADKSGEIKITAFNTELEKFFPLIENNKVYIIGRASVKNADKRYTTADFEITLNSDSIVELVGRDDDVPLAKFNFISLASLTSENLPTSPVDMIGAIKEITDVSTVISKTKNKELKKRNVTIVDATRHTIEVTIWGEQAETFSATVGDIFVTKGARVGSYGGRSASAGDCIFINPDIPEARKLKNWFGNLLDDNFTSLTSSSGGAGANDQWKSISELLNLEQAKMALSGGQTAVYAKCKAVLMAVGKNPVYKCCPLDGCGKKLSDTQNGEMKCEKCQQTYTRYKNRYKLDIEIEDASGSAWVTLWDEKAEGVLKMTPQELETLMLSDNKEEYEKRLNKPTFNSYIFSLRSRIDTYQNEERVKLAVANIFPLDMISYSKRLMAEIKQMSES